MRLLNMFAKKKADVAAAASVDEAAQQLEPTVPDHATISYDGATLDLHPALNGVDKKLFLYGEYEPDVRSLIKRILKPGNVAFDVGAHLGHHSATMSSRVGANGRVFSLEPAPDRFKVLARNMADQTQVTPIQVGLSSSATTVALSNEARISPIIRTERTDLTVDVRTQTLPALMDLYGISTIDLIKMDIEGHEAEALIGAAPRIQDVRHMIVEIHTDFIVSIYGAEKLEKMIEVLATFPKVNDLKHEMKRVKDVADKIRKRRRPQFLFSRP